MKKIYTISFYAFCFLLIFLSFKISSAATLLTYINQQYKFSFSHLDGYLSDKEIDNKQSQNCPGGTSEGCIKTLIDNFKKEISKICGNNTTCINNEVSAYTDLLNTAKKQQEQYISSIDGSKKDILFKKYDGTSRGTNDYFTASIKNNNEILYDLQIPDGFSDETPYTTYYFTADGTLIKKTMKNNEYIQYNRSNPSKINAITQYSSPTTNVVAVKSYFINGNGVSFYQIAKKDKVMASLIIPPLDPVLNDRNIYCAFKGYAVCFDVNTPSNDDTNPEKAIMDPIMKTFKFSATAPVSSKVETTLNTKTSISPEVRSDGNPTVESSNDVLGTPKKDSIIRKIITFFKGLFN